MRQQTILTMGLRYIVLTIFVIFTALPFYWMLIATFKSNTDLYRPANNPFFFNYDEVAAQRDLPQSPTLTNLDLLLNRTNYLGFVRNSLIVGVSVVVITLLFCVPAAYSLARLTGSWGERLGILMFIVYLVPPTLLFLPMSRLVSTLGLRDSILSLILVYPSFTIPFCTWLLMGFMKSIPEELEGQAMVDGYTRWGAIWRVIFPLAAPGILTVIVFAFTLTTHEFIYALAFITASSNKVISTGISSELIRGDVFFWQSIMAAGIIVAIPVAILYNIFLDRFVAGLTLGAVKG